MGCRACAEPWQKSRVSWVSWCLGVLPGVSGVHAGIFFLASSKLFAFPSSRLKDPIKELKARVTHDKVGTWSSLSCLS